MPTLSLSESALNALDNTSELMLALEACVELIMDGVHDVTLLPTDEQEAIDGLATELIWLAVGLVGKKQAAELFRLNHGSAVEDL